jgi:hypothetical protein
MPVLGDFATGIAVRVVKCNFPLPVQLRSAFSRQATRFLGFGSSRRRKRRCQSVAVVPWTDPESGRFTGLRQNATRQDS